MEIEQYKIVPFSQISHKGGMFVLAHFVPLGSGWWACYKPCFV